MFYTNVTTRGNFVLLRGVKDGVRFNEKVKYKPSLFIPTNKKTEYKTLDKKYLAKVDFESIHDARDWIEGFKDVTNFNYYGNTQWNYQYIAENFNKMEFDLSLIRKIDIDIETDSENGFPEPELANERVIAITCIVNAGDAHCWGLKDYKPNPDEIYTKCSSESELLLKFLDFWSEDYPDIVTGWNITGFDIPYLVNRINKVLGEKMVNKLSPWGTVYERKIKETWGERQGFTILGVSNMDYLEIYKKFSMKNLENFRLETVCQEELGEGKVAYEEEYGSLANLYEKNPQLFMYYNIIDVRRVDQLDKKTGLMDMVLTLAYDMKCNFDDVFQQTRMWDSAINCHLREKNIVVPKKVIKERQSFEGAFVIPPKTGMHKWVVSFDLNSLYPHVIMQYNISPETLIQPEDYDEDMRRVISEGVSVEKLLNKEIDLSWMKGRKITITPSGQFFRTDVKGFLPEMLEQKYSERKTIKNRMLQCYREYETGKADASILIEAQQCERTQWSKKISLNSAYGNLGTEFSRYYDVRLASSVTAGARLSLLWIRREINKWMNKASGNEGKDYALAGDTDSYPRSSKLTINNYTTTIGDFYENCSFIKKDVLEYGNEVKHLGPDANYTTFSYDYENDCIKATKVKYVMKHKVKKRMFTLKVNNKSVTVTEDHSVMFKRNDVLMSGSVKDMRQGDIVISIGE